MRIFGVGGDSMEKREGNLAANASGVRSRFVLIVDWVGLVARSVAVLARGFPRGCTGCSSSTSLAESIMLSLSSSSSLSPTSNCSRVASSSSFCLFNRSTSTLTPRPSPVSLSVSSHTLFLSSVRGIFFLTLSSRNSGFLSSSLFRRNRSSRLRLSRAFFCLT